jgi:nucleoside-diphosphate kinase
MERTFVIVKPDGVRRALVGEIIRRFEQRGFRIAALKLVHPSRELAESHYGVHRGKPFFESTVQFITSGPVVAMVVEGADAVTGLRQIMGATNPLDAAPGSIRGDFATVITENIVHGSDSLESAEREIGLFFG